LLIEHGEGYVQYTGGSIWEQAVKILADAGCEAVVGLPTDEWGLLDAAAASRVIRAIPVRDQRIGACLAVGFATIVHRPVVLALSSGPSFANALAGLVEAASLAAPIVIITNRIPVSSLGRGGFQELEQARMAETLLRWHIRVEEPASLAWALRRAVHMSLNGGGGLSFVEITDEVSHQKFEEPTLHGAVSRLAALPAEAALEHAIGICVKARRPLILLGGGAWAAGAVALEFAQCWPAPIFTTASGRGSIDETHDLACGLVGLYATPPADQLLAQADVVLVVGSKLEETARMGWEHLAHCTLVQIDATVETFGLGASPDLCLLGDATLTVQALATRLMQHADQLCTEASWKEHISSVKQQLLATYSTASFATAPVRATFRAINTVFGTESIFVQENGLHDIWGYHYPVLTIGAGGCVVLPGEQTTMGFGLPAALGAALSTSERAVVAICGDGALGMNFSALLTARELGCGLTVIVFDNRGFGWPRFCRRIEGVTDVLTHFQIPLPIAELALAYGCRIAQPENDHELLATLHNARRISAEGGIALVRIAVNNEDDLPVGVQGIFGATPEQEHKT
jgi:acetolactate synthase-1/2/3 large subunit